MRHATVDLAFGEHGVHQNSQIVDHRVFDDFRIAGVGVDLDLAEMGSVRVGASVQFRGRFGRQQIDSARRPRGVRGVHQRHRLVGAFRAEQSVVEFDIRFRMFKLLGGERHEFFDHAVRSQIDRNALRRDGARPAGSAALPDQIAVPLHEIDLLERNAGSFVQNLREGGLVALAVRLGAHVHVDAAALGEFDFGGFRRIPENCFDIVAKADAPESAFRLGFASPRRKPGNIRLRFRALQDLVEVADIEGLIRKIQIRKLFGRNEVLAPQFELADA